MNAMFLYFNNTVVKYTKTNPEITKPHSEEHFARLLALCGIKMVQFKRISTQQR